MQELVEALNDSRKEVDELIKHSQAASGEVEGLRQESRLLERRRRQWENRCASREDELDEARCELALLRVKVEDVLYRYGSTATSGSRRIEEERLAAIAELATETTLRKSS